jgi:flagellar hook-associated protein 2
MASGLPPNLVDQLVEAERIPVKQMEVKKTKQEDVLKLVTDLDTKLSEITKGMGELLSTRGFMDTKLISGDTNVIDGSVDPNASVTGEYSVEVLQLAQKPGAISNGFPDKNETQMGVGYIKFTTNEGTKDVYIKGADSTLEGVAKQINASNIGLRATVIQDRKDRESPFRLMVTGLATGDEKQVEFPTIYLLDGDQDMYFDESRPSQNAKIKLDGFEMEIPENQSSDLIPGVNLDLKQAAPGRPIRINVKENLEAISGKVKNFVDAYNGALGFIQNQHKLQKNSSTGKDSLGPLGGDSMIRSVENRLRRIITTSQVGVESPITRVGELGIEFNRNGTLNFSQEKFTKTLNENPKGVAAFLRGDGFATGFVPTLKREIANLQNSSFGPVANRKKSVQQKIDRLNDQIERKGKQIDKKEDQLRKKFADLESKMSGLQSQGAAVAGITNIGVKPGGN